eukprot:1137150-Pelagomonas_calceolata.AAC.12
MLGLRVIFEKCYAVSCTQGAAGSYAQGAAGSSLATTQIKPIMLPETHVKCMQGAGSHAKARVKTGRGVNNSGSYSENAVLVLCMQRAAGGHAITKLAVLMACMQGAAGGHGSR